MKFRFNHDDGNDGLARLDFIRPDIGLLNQGKLEKNRHRNLFKRVENNIYSRY